jgi:hypothetical protein
MLRVLALVLIVLVAAACGAPPAATPDLAATQVALAVKATLTAAAPVPTATLIPVPSATEAPLPSPVPTSTKAPPPSPVPTATAPSASACPAPGNPPLPSRPETFDQYAVTLEAFLDDGGSAEQLERLLQDWGAITADLGSVRSLDMTGDGDPEIVVSAIDPAPEAGAPPWPPGDVLIFQCQAGSVGIAYQGRLERQEDWNWFSFHLQEVQDTNGNGLADLVYVTSTCGAHTCFDQLFVIEWNGVTFSNRVPDMESYPYPTFTVGSGRIVVDVGGIGSAGAGVQRSHTEIWNWDGERFAFGEQITGPPLVLVHFVHDGDAALAQGRYAEAAVQYEQALSTTGMSSGLFSEGEQEGTALVRAYARFKLVVAWAAAGDGVNAETEYNRLGAEHPAGSPGSIYASLGQTFWEEWLASGDPGTACAAVVAVAQGDPAPAELLYAGYGNPEYGPAELCDLPE